MATRTSPASFAEALDRFPSLRALSREMRLAYPTVVSWRRRDNIPQEHWDDLEAAAKRLGVRLVTYGRLREIARAARTARPAR